MQVCNTHNNNNLYIMISVSNISNWSQVGHNGQHSHVQKGDTRVSLALANNTYPHKLLG